MVSEEQDNEEQLETEEEKYPGVEKLRSRLKWILTDDFKPTEKEKAEIFAQFGLFSESLLMQSRFSSFVEAILEYIMSQFDRLKELEANQPELAEQIDPLLQEADEVGQTLTEVKELAHTMKKELPQEFYGIQEFKKSIREEMQSLKDVMLSRIGFLEKLIYLLFIFILITIGGPLIVNKLGI